ncbi:ABC transporter substrate-binding protein [Fusibacter sp. JL298sf-3]
MAGKAKWIMVAVAVVLIGSVWALRATRTEEVTTIGILQFIEHPALDAAKEGFVEALEASDVKGDVVFLEKNAQGDMATAQMIAASFESKGVDLIYAIATPAAQAAYNATDTIPILISAVTDPQAAGLVTSNERPETNVTGTSDAAPLKEQLALLETLVPKAKRIGFLYNTGEQNATVQLEQLKAATALEVVPMGVTSLTELEQGLEQLLTKVDVLYTPADNLVASGIHLIADRALKQGVAILGAEPAHVEAGALATVGVDYRALGRQTGAMALRILDGTPVATTPVETADAPQTVINLDTAEALDITVPDALSESRFLGGDHE